MASTISSVLVREGSWSTVTRAEANFTDTSVTPFSFPTRFSILATQGGQLKPSARKMLRVVAGVVVIVMPFFDLWSSRRFPRGVSIVESPAPRRHDGEQSTATCHDPRGQLVTVSTVSTA